MSEKYDVIIIGAGIGGGLVCGCYLAKTGMKALIAFGAELKATKD